MGQIVRRNKKGRPAKADPGARELAPPKTDLRRSLRRRNVKYVFDLDDYFDEDEFFADDEEQRRREKKLKHLLKIQGDGEPESAAPRAGRTRRLDHAPATSASSSDDGGKPSKKRKIDEDMDEDMDDENDYANEEDNYNDDNEEEVRERKPEPRNEDSHTGTPTDGLPMPDKRSLEFILDKLQKKDIYGVYAEPVDPEELPDYHDIIEHPMDFATVKNKLRNGSYATFEQFESDVFLICSNAMQYNAPDTIYHKQARSIQEMAKKKFQKIRLNVEHLEKEIKAEQGVRSGSNLKKQIKRPVSRTVQEPVGSDFSSGATLATAEDIQNATNAIQTVVSEKSGYADGLVEGNSFLNDNNMDKAEEPLSGKGALSRFGRKSSVQDENRRATYSISLSHPVDSTESIFSTFEGETKQLVPVGLYSDYSYARSLSHFSAALGSMAWKVASKRIEQALPQGFKFGRGWVGEYEPPPTPVLILENCSVKEPPFLAKLLPATDPKKFGKIPVTSVSSNEGMGNATFLDRKLPFHGHAGSRPPPVCVSTTQSTRTNISEMKASLLLSPGVKPNGFPNTGFQHQNLQSGAIFTESEKKFPKQVELNVPPSSNTNVTNSVGMWHISKSSEIDVPRSMEFASKNINFSRSGSFKQPDGNGVAFGGLQDGKIVGNSVDSNTIACSSSDLAKPASFYTREQFQAPSDRVQLMRMLGEKAQNQQKPSNQPLADDQVLHSAPSLSSTDSNNAAVAAARAWMSVGATGFRPVTENPNLNKNQMSADSLHNSTRDVQLKASRFHGELPASGNVQLDKNSSAIHTFVPQGSIPTMYGNAIPFQNQRVVLPQLAATDSSKLQAQPMWRNLSPQMRSRQKQESLPPDLNIGYQPSGSPGRPSSGVLVDSQQPDLALQL